MKNFKVAKKLFISYALVLGLLAAGSIVSIVDLIGLGKQLEIFYEGPLAVKDSANLIHSNFERMQKSVYRALSNTDQEIVDESIAKAKDSAAVIQEQLPIVRERFLGDPQIVERLEDAFNRLTPMREHVLKLAAENRDAEAAAYMEQNNIRVIREAQAELDALIENGNAKGEALIDGLRGRQTSAIVTLAVLGSFSVLVSLLFGIYITRGITQPVQELEKAAHDLANGELSAIRIEYRSEDELGQLAEDMRGMAATLSEVIRDETYLLKEMAEGNFNVHSGRRERYVGELKQILDSMEDINGELSETLLRINQSADEVTSGSEQVSSSAQVLAQGAAEQASSIEELSGSIEEISAQAFGNAQKSHEASKASRIVRLNADESSRFMQEMLDSIEDISDKSSKIGEINTTIENIAFQTNLLALNAAVEAARAGEQGKGFSVVAREVRSLASQSAEASKNTAALLESCLEAVENGKKIAGKTASSLLEVVEGIDRVSESLGHITDSSLKQSDSIRQITENVNLISNVIQTNSATAEESAAASEELSSQAQLLNQLVNQFQLKETIKKSKK